MALTPEIRSKLVHLLNTGTIESPVWSFINEGVTELTENFNADTNTLQYVGEEQSTTYTRKYAPNISLSAVVVSGDPVNEWIQTQINTLPVGSAANTQYIRFNILDKVTGQDNSYKAYMRGATIAVDSIGGSAGEEIGMSLTLNGTGSQVEGTVTMTKDSTSGAVTYTFTANS